MTARMIVPPAALVAGVLGVAALVAGCSPRTSARETHGQAHHEGEQTTAASYKAGHGVQLGSTAAAFVGLRIGDVETRDLPGAPAVAAIPREALLQTVRGAFVYVENGGWLLRAPVVVGASADGWIEVRDGLYEGDRVAVAGVEALWLAEIAAINGGVGCADGH